VDVRPPETYYSERDGACYIRCKHVFSERFIDGIRPTYIDIRLVGERSRICDAPHGHCGKFRGNPDTSTRAICALDFGLGVDRGSSLCSRIGAYDAISRRDTRVSVAGGKLCLDGSTRVLLVPKSKRAKIFCYTSSIGTAGAVPYTYDEAGHLLGEYDGTGALFEGASKTTSLAGFAGQTAGARARQSRVSRRPD
jgi:hypothetical protein